MTSLPDRAVASRLGETFPQFTLGDMVTRVASALLFLLVSPSLFAQAKRSVSAELEVRDALAKFVHAFDNLDWESFRLAFDDDATVFYPRGFPERANGRAEFEKTFKVVFQQIRSGKTGAPYMDIQPKDMRLQMFAILPLQHSIWTTGPDFSIDELSY